MDIEVDYDKLANPYYVNYNMMILALKNDDIYSNILDALNFIKVYMEADGIALYKLIDNKYFCVNNQFDDKSSFNYISRALSLGKVSVYLEKSSDLQFDTSINGEMSNLIFLSICFDDFKYVVAIYGGLKDRYNNEFLTLLNQSFMVVLKRYEEYERSSKDVLTGLYNRKFYEKMISELNNSDEKVIFIFFDLFRLKYVNDNFGHLVGDDYIIKASQVLKKYFPMNDYYVDEFGILQKRGNNLFAYKIGGDEFVIISKSDNYADMKNRADCAFEETKKIDLNVNRDVILGLNYGMSMREGCESISSLYNRADKLLNDNKTIMYKSLEISRRK